MTETPSNRKINIWPNSKSIVLETVVIICMTLCLLALQYGSIEFSALPIDHFVFTVLGSLGVWFINRFTLGNLLQSRIDANKVTKRLPFELMAASVGVTSLVYVFVYSIFSYFKGLDFVLTSFLQGFFITLGISLLFAILYVGGQVWKSWWSDGEFLFQVKENSRRENGSKNFITLKNAKGSVNVALDEVHYFVSESKIVFLIDSSGKRWITQYNLSELEQTLGDRFFRLNRKILVSRQVISQIKKLPNHRLLVTIGSSDKNHTETISRYKSTKFKQWFHNGNPV